LTFKTLQPQNKALKCKTVNKTQKVASQDVSRPTLTSLEFQAWNLAFSVTWKIHMDLQTEMDWCILTATHGRAHTLWTN